MMILNQQPYPLNAFPQRIYYAALETVKIYQVTHIIAGTTTLTALSVSAGPSVDWKHPVTRQIRPSVLNQAILAISGDRKSSAEEMMCRPIYAHDAAAILAQKEDIKSYKKALSRWNAIGQGLLSLLSKLKRTGLPISEADAKLEAHEALEPVKPISQRIIRQDVTYRSVFESLEGNGKSIALMTDEGKTVLDSAVMRHHGFLNHAWDGKSLLTLERADNDNTIVQNPRVTISIMVQPNVFQKHLDEHGEDAQDSGFWARYLLSRSPSIQGYRIQWMEAPEPVDLLPFHARVSELLQQYQQKVNSGNVVRDVLEFDDDAKRLWHQISVKVEEHFQPGKYLFDISDFGNKYMDQVGRVAALLHYFEANTAEILEAPHGEIELTDDQAEKSAIVRKEARAAKIGKITADVLERAESIAGWHLHEYKAIFSQAMQRPAVERDADLIYGYLYRNFYVMGLGETAKNSVRRTCGVRNTRGDGKFDNAFNLLLVNQVIRTKPVPRVGSTKTTETIELNWDYFNTHPIQ